MQTDLHAGLWWPLISRYLAACNRWQASEEPAIVEMLSRLPHDALTALEFPLRSDPRSALPDISQCIETPSQVDHLLAGDQSSGWSDLLRRWRRERWADESGLLASLSVVWLEFDLRRSEHPEPLVCLYLPIDDRQDLLPWLDALPGRQQVSSSRQAEVITTCLKEAPSKAGLMYLFDLSAREEGAIRLEWYGVQLQDMAPFLERLGAPVPLWLGEVIELIGDGDRLHLSFDLRPDGTFNDRIGIEISYAKLAGKDPRWEGLFRRLTVAGFCDAEAPEAIWRWLGQDQKGSAGPFWPSQPELRSGHLARVLSHVKIVGRAQERPIAKTYLLFRYLERRPTQRSRPPGSP